MKPLCKLEDLQTDTPMRVEIPGSAALVLYKVEEQVFATDDVCTHGQASLSDGFQEGPIIECPFHAGAFDVRTGAAIRFPCTIPLKTYAVCVREGWVCLKDDGGPAPSENTKPD